MTLEIRPPFPRPRPHFPRLPHRRFYGGRYAPVYYEPQVIEVERIVDPTPSLPWRTVQQVSNGPLKVVSQHAAMEDALKAFKEGQARLRKLRPRCCVTFSLQHWTGSMWKTEGTWTAGSVPSKGLGSVGQIMRFVKLWRPDGSAAQPLSPGLPPSVVAKMRRRAGWKLLPGGDPNDPNAYV